MNHTPKISIEEAVFSSSWIFCFRRKELRFRPRSCRVNAGEQSSNELRFCLSHFLSRRTSLKRSGPRVAPKSSCGDAPLVNAIPSSAMDAAASRRTMSITTGLTSGAAVAPVVGRPSPSCRAFRSLTRTTVCGRAVRHCGGVLWNIAPGKRPRLRSGTRIVCLIPPRSAAGRAVWTPLNRLSLFSAKRSPAPLTGCWRVVILPITKLGLCLG